MSVRAAVCTPAGEEEGVEDRRDLPRGGCRHLDSLDPCPGARGGAAAGPGQADHVRPRFGLTDGNPRLRTHSVEGTSEVHWGKADLCFRHITPHITRWMGG